MERFGSMYKSVGMPDPEDEKKGTGNKRLLKYTQERFKNPLEFIDDKERINKISRPKTPEEKHLHQRADQISNTILEKYNVDPFTIPGENIILVKRGKWPEEAGKDAGGLYNPEAQLIALEETPVKMEMARNMLHEQLHFKSYNAMQGITADSQEGDKTYLFIDDYRIGLTINSRDGKNSYFLNLNEAITEELVKRSSEELFDDSVFADEKEQFKTMQRANEHMKESSEYDAVMDIIDDPDTIYANLFSADSEIGRTLAPEGEGDQVFHSVKFAYPKQRAALNVLIQKIYTQNSDDFKGEDAVFDEFAKAALSGRLLPLARLIDNTFGSGTFRKIGEADPKINKLANVIDEL